MKEHWDKIGGQVRWEYTRNRVVEARWNQIVLSAHIKSAPRHHISTVLDIIHTDTFDHWSVVYDQVRGGIPSD